MLHSRKLYAALLTMAMAFSTATNSAPALAQEGDSKMKVSTLGEMPVGITSFGGALCNGSLYVFGGHDGAAHEYYDSGQNHVLYQLNLADPDEWKAVNKSPNGRQGLAMVAHGGKLYRMGGFIARNKRGEDQDLHSVANFDVFDPESGEWTELPPMPEPRSSFDSVVIGDKIYIVGGWAMSGEGDTEWLETAWSFDLAAENPEWEPLPDPPFQRRAMSLSFQGDDLFVIGGMQQRGGPTRSVERFNLKTGKWSSGPELPGEEAMEGFGNSSFNIAGNIYVSTYGGHVYQLNDDATDWNKMGTLDTGRFFHRLLPVSDHQFALVGGASMQSGKTTDVLVVDIK